jgi:hypothetical protein
VVLGVADGDILSASHSLEFKWEVIHEIDVFVPESGYLQHLIV